MARKTNTFLIVIGFILLAILIVMLFNGSNKTSDVYVMRPNEITRNVYMPSFRLLRHLDLSFGIWSRSQDLLFLAGGNWSSGSGGSGSGEGPSGWVVVPPPLGILNKKDLVLIIFYYKLSKIYNIMLSCFFVDLFFLYSFFFFFFVFSLVFFLSSFSKFFHLLVSSSNNSYFRRS